MLKRLFFLTVGLTISSYALSEGRLIQINQNHIMRLEQEIADQHEQIEGLRSLVEGLNTTVAQLQEQMHRLQAHKKHAQPISNQAIAHPTPTAKTTPPMTQKEPTLSQHAQSAPELYKAGVHLFSQKAYDKASQYFIESASKGYKKAASNYYLGEIAYYTKQYSDAIFYYKKSVSLDHKASYMDVLLLHTAISLERSGKKEKAKLFYDNVIEQYPTTKAASIAKSRLRSL